MSTDTAADPEYEDVYLAGPRHFDTCINDEDGVPTWRMKDRVSQVISIKNNYQIVLIIIHLIIF